uniref:Secreted protein n=1 Tax=Magallana gigas TaxID=29159 RepID=A0A8W8NSL4_MAGGI|nr:uncharacterized protein LOC105320531 [Crassostrea gigas]
MGLLVVFVFIFAIGTTVLAGGEDHTIAQAACTGMGSEKRYTAAIPRERGGKSCQDICSSVTDMDEDNDYPGTKPYCIEGILIYQKKGPKDTLNTKWMNTWKYGAKGCVQTKWGPNFCCCSL